MRYTLRRSGGRTPRWPALLVGALLIAGAPAEELAVEGPVYYGDAAGASNVAVVQIREIYANNPAYIRLEMLGLSETDGGRGTALFAEAQAAARRALARVAQTHGLDVITEVGGVRGAEPADRTSEVIDQLPHFHVEGKVLHGTERNARELAELDSLAVLMAIPSYVEAQGLDQSNARFHILQKDYQDRFTDAVRRTARNLDLDVIVERGAATSRFGPVRDVTQQAVAALAE